MGYSVYDLVGLFFIYSVLGWLLETAAAAVKRRKFVNRGFFNGPICTLYGSAAVLMTVFLGELKNSLFFLFLGCMILATLTEWFGGHILCRMGHGKWWDYSGKKWNMDGYICLEYSVVWGVLGVLSMKYLNELILGILHLIPIVPRRITLLVLIAIFLIDGIGSYAVLHHLTRTMPKILAMNDQIDAFTKRLGIRIYRSLEGRMEKAYPNVQQQTATVQKQEVFAQGCSFYKLILLFFIGAFLGDLVETVFCRITAGVWMSRSSVVWGPFSIVWGLAISLATWFLYNYRERSDGFLFFFGTFLGGAYEYLCSVFTELVFGQVFWDYSDIPFNLGGRINLLYCFFWGIAAVIWLKKLYPLVSGIIEKIPIKPGKIITWVLIVFMVCNVTVSALALVRYSEREYQVPADHAWQQFMDEHYDDQRMNRIYPNAASTGVQEEFT
ncbi:MAG: putative ABC transporter permease [Fusicatenibacter sp.]|nr:putative ABC transporter permease [Fusicatenibacter sp.]